MLKPCWVEEQRLFKMTEVFLECRCLPGRPIWLMEDPDFLKSIWFGASCVYDESSYLQWLAAFVSKLNEHSQDLADKVTVERIKKYRPDVYKAWNTRTHDRGEEE